MESPHVYRTVESSKDLSSCPIYYVKKLYIFICFVFLPVNAEAITCICSQNSCMRKLFRDQNCFHKTEKGKHPRWALISVPKQFSGRTFVLPSCGGVIKAWTLWGLLMVIARRDIPSPVVISPQLELGTTRTDTSCCSDRPASSGWLCSLCQSRLSRRRCWASSNPGNIWGSPGGLWERRAPPSPPCSPQIWPPVAFSPTLGRDKTPERRYPHTALQAFGLSPHYLQENILVI